MHTAVYMYYNVLRKYAVISSTLKDGWLYFSIIQLVVALLCGTYVVLVILPSVIVLSVTLYSYTVYSKLKLNLVLLCTVYCLHTYCCAKSECTAHPPRIFVTNVKYCIYKLHYVNDSIL
jgi:hypothetical protein